MEQHIEDMDMINIDRGYDPQDVLQDESFNKFILSNDDMINKFIAFCLGMMYNADEKKLYHIGTAQPVRVMNDYGVVRWAGFLANVTDKGVLHSNLNREEVAELAFQTLMDVAADIFENSEKYDLDISNFDLFLAQIKMIVFTTLKRPQEAGERRAINTRGKSIEHVMRKEGYEHQRPEPQQGFSLFRGK